MPRTRLYPADRSYREFRFANSLTAGTHEPLQVVDSVDRFSGESGSPTQGSVVAGNAEM